MLTQKALDIANYFIEIASKIDENDLTNLKLQKLLYLTQGKYIAEKGEGLFTDDIEAWNLGPVVRNVYNTFKRCGAFPITAFDVKVEAQELSDDKKRFIEKIWNEYAKYSASYLVDLAHNSTPWEKAYKSSSKIISNEEMLAYFRKNKLT